MEYKSFEQFFDIPLRNGLTKPKKVRGKGFKMINMGELFAFPRINNIQMDRVPLNEKERENYLVEKGDLLFARQSLVREGAGKCSIFIDDNEVVCFESHLIRCRLRKDISNPLFFYYYFASRKGKLTIDAIIEQGAGAAGIRGSDLAQVLVPNCAKSKQDKIANILGKIDDKIELNTQINQTLEQIAQAIFKSWFVDFDPVKAKIAVLESGGTKEEAERSAMSVISGKDEMALDALKDENPEAYSELEKSAALFPSVMQNSELGQIPHGWEIKNVGDYLDTVSKTYPLKTVTEVIFLNTGDIQNGKFLHAKKTAIEKLPGQAKKSIKKGDILYSEIRPHNRRYAFVYFDANNYVVSTKLMVLRSSANIASEYLYYIVTQQSVINYLQVIAESRSGTFPQITFDVLSKVKLVVPNNLSIIEVFTDKYLKKIMKKRWLIDEENLKLENIRDTLLPKLLSGEIDVSTLLEVAE
ncbi:MAG: restriction endonuclease subunit S [Deltaproteobacteria bacterium]|nr:restriction endonuclease subunit S [Deltaproteobacteria bacterium]